MNKQQRQEAIARADQILARGPQVLVQAGNGINRRARRAKVGASKPPVPWVKPHLPGDHACTARATFLNAATDGGRHHAAEVGPALARIGFVNDHPHRPIPTGADE